MRRRALVAVGAWAALVLSLELSDSNPNAVVLAGIVGAATALVFVIADLAATVGRVRWTRRSRPAHRTRRNDPRVDSLRRQVRAAWWSGSTDVADTLIELLDDRLLAHRRVDRSVDPVVAVTLLTPRLRRLVDGPRRQIASVGELEQIVADIEAL